MKWLRYYDMFYEYCSSQYHVAEEDVVTPSMVENDTIVDAFIAWYEWKYEQKQEEWRAKKEQREEHEAEPPAAGAHPEVFRAAHR